MTMGPDPTMRIFRRSERLGTSGLLALRAPLGRSGGLLRLLRCRLVCSAGRLGLLRGLLALLARGLLLLAAQPVGDAPADALLLGLFFDLQLGADQLDQGHFRGVALAPPETEDAQVPAGAIDEARRERVEELLHDGRVVDVAGHEAPGVEPFPLRERDELLGEGPQRLRPRDGGADALLVEERCRQGAKCGLAMSR